MREEDDILFKVIIQGLSDEGVDFTERSDRYYALGQLKKRSTDAFSS